MASRSRTEFSEIDSSETVQQSEAGRDPDCGSSQTLSPLSAFISSSGVFDAGELLPDAGDTETILIITLIDGQRSWP